MFPIFRSRHQTETHYHLLHVIYPNPVNGHKHLLPSHTLVQTSQVNSNKSPNQMQKFSSLLSWRLFTAHHVSGVFPPCSDSLWFYLRIVVITVLCSWSGRPARPRTQHDCHHDTKVKPEAATSHWAPDDGRKNARNMLSCKQTSG
jgi:hypothetical protein